MKLARMFIGHSEMSKKALVMRCQNESQRNLKRNLMLQRLVSLITSFNNKTVFEEQHFVITVRTFFLQLKENQNEIVIFIFYAKRNNNIDIAGLLLQREYPTNG